VKQSVVIYLESVTNSLDAVILHDITRQVQNLQSASLSNQLSQARQKRRIQMTRWKVEFTDAFVLAPKIAQHAGRVIKQICVTYLKDCLPHRMTQSHIDFED
jgi:hypothetical protein